MAAKGPGSSPHGSSRTASPRRAAWCRRYSTTAASRRRSYLPSAGRPSSELGVFVDRVEAQLDAYARQLERRIPGDYLVDPAGLGAGVEIDQTLILLDNRVLPDRDSGKVIQLFPSAINTFGAR